MKLDIRFRRKSGSIELRGKLYGSERFEDGFTFFGKDAQELEDSRRTVDAWKAAVEHLR
jgi:hypothetical protein